MIQKIIHQIWFQGEDIPDKYIKFQESCKKMHSKWDYMLWTEEKMYKLLNAKYPWFIPIFDAYPLMIQKIDAFKFFCLHAFGGVYIDMDMECIRPLDPLLEGESFVISRFDLDRFRFSSAKKLLKLNLKYNNGFIAASKDHPLLMELAKGLKNYQLKKGFGKVSTAIYVSQSTGPSYVSDIIEKHIGKIKELERKLIETKENEKIQDTSYIIHHTKATWSPLVHNTVFIHDWLFTKTNAPNRNIVIFVLFLVFVLVLSSLIPILLMKKRNFCK